jgi:hypothetical protein
MKLQEGDFDTAQQYINQAIADKTADQKYNLDLFQTFYQMNQDSIDRLDKNQQQAIQNAADEADRAMRQAQFDETMKWNREKERVGVDGITVPDEWSGTVGTTLSMVPATKAKEIKATLTTALTNRDWTTAYATMANAVEQGLTGADRTQFASARTDIGVMSGMRDAIQKYAASGGDMGLLTGTVANIEAKLGQSTGNKEKDALRVQLLREFQQYRVNITGAAFSPAESREYAAVNPRLNASLDLNLNTIDGALAQLENRVTSAINARVPGASTVYKNLQTFNQSATSGWDPDAVYDINGNVVRQSSLNNNDPLGIL